MTSAGGDGVAEILTRSATNADFDSIVVLELEVFGRAAWSPQTVDAEFAALGSSRFIAVAEVEGQVIGYGVLLYVGDLADIQRVAVKLSSRRRGIATQLLTALLAEAARLGCARALLEVAADNSAASRLYAAQGFTEIARRPRYYPGDVDALVLELTLPGTTASGETPS